MAQQSEKEASYVSHGASRREPASKRMDQIHFDERFECQPEYRKAYIAYLTRENISRLPRAFANFEEPTPTEAGSFLSETPELKEPPPKPRYKSPYAPPKISTRDRSVPRTPKQETVLVPDLSGHNIVRRASSIFGPKPLRQSISKPESPRSESPVGTFKIAVPPPDFPQTPKKRKSRSKQVIEKPKTSTSRDRSVPTSPCHKHRSPSGKPCPRRHSPCARLSRQGSTVEKKSKNSGKKSPSDRKENIPIHLFPPTPTKEKLITSRIKTSSVEQKSTKQEKLKVPSRKSSKEERMENVASFVVLQDDDINNNQTKNIDGKERRWMRSWYENGK